MKSILLVAHGSRRAASNDEVRELTARLRERRGNSEIFECAFLELAEPSIPDGIQQCIDRGATEVSVLPYFLSAGRHVAEDIPNEVKLKQDEHPETRIVICSYLGSSELLQDALLHLADS